MTDEIMDGCANCGCTLLLFIGACLLGGFLLHIGWAIL